jgi:hypothetical protein
MDVHLASTSSVNCAADARNRFRTVVRVVFLSSQSLVAAARVYLQLVASCHREKQDEERDLVSVSSVSVAGSFRFRSEGGEVGVVITSLLQT